MIKERKREMATKLFDGDEGGTNPAPSSSNPGPNQFGARSYLDWCKAEAARFSEVEERFGGSRYARVFEYVDDEGVEMCRLDYMK